MGYGTDAVQGIINRLKSGKNNPLLPMQLVFELDTLKISGAQIFPNFQLSMENSSPPPEAYSLINQSYQLDKQIVDSIDKAHYLGQSLFGVDWVRIKKEIENVQAIPRL
ncbi:hypothetical protein ACOI1C_22085 [Bacillus sp. DJP31]|uniref:hypothetical protein n=1 Tax=Bacillus sp. DJP31 TaxID=3409789 RepID=UPI003BB5C856